MMKFNQIGMMMTKISNKRRIRILPYRQGSASAKALSVALGGKVLKLEGSGFTPRLGDVIINWGNTTQGGVGGTRGVLNPAQGIRLASNKLIFFNMMEDKEMAEFVPPFWEDKDEIPEDAFPIVCRTVLAGHSGDGIVIAADRDGLVDAPLYVKYIKKQDEYRIHVGRDGDQETVTISVQKKVRRLEEVNPNWQIRNHANGFVYARQNVSPPACVIVWAHAALLASGLDFGAVDVIYNAHADRAYVLEINTAPGLEGQTVTDYAEYFNAL